MLRVHTTRLGPRTGAETPPAWPWWVLVAERAAHHRGRLRKSTRFAFAGAPSRRTRYPAITPGPALAREEDPLGAFVSSRSGLQVRRMYRTIVHCEGTVVVTQLHGRPPPVPKEAPWALGRGNKTEQRARPLTLLSGALPRSWAIAAEGRGVHGQALATARSWMVWCGRHVYLCACGVVDLGNMTPTRRCGSLVSPWGSTTRLTTMTCCSSDVRYSRRSAEESPTSVSCMHGAVQEKDARVF